jgi:hypothetical protein
MAHTEIYQLHPKISFLLLLLIIVKKLLQWAGTAAVEGNKKLGISLFKKS